MFHVEMEVDWYMIEQKLYAINVNHDIISHIFFT